MKKKIGELLLQIIPVMIGVYLGFIVTNWGENRKSRKQAETLIANILSEIEINQGRLENVVDYHVMLRDSSRYYSNAQVRMTKPRFFEGTRVVRLTNSAYTTGVQTGVINELPIAQIQAINQVYTFQNDYNEFGNLMMASLLNRDFSENEENMRAIARFLSVSMTDVVIKENDLLEGYAMIKKKLGS